MGLSSAFWSGRRVFVTGHTGFKGAWLCLLLDQLGARVTGYALPPQQPSVFDAAGVAKRMTSVFADVRDAPEVARQLAAARPDIVIHMAAQSLVRRSYDAPLETYEVNTMGTANLLDAVRAAGSVRAVVVVTTDKCYRNEGLPTPFRETDPLGGRDPYSNSKACAELVTASYRDSFLAAAGVAVASARAGNVIGGGDWADDRLVPDLIRAFQSGRGASIRHPGFIRPWQHVLEPLSGYLQLAERLHSEGMAYAEAWNFGPAEEDARTVGEVADTLARAWGSGARWEPVLAADAPHEASVLRLDWSKARTRLGWAPHWTLDRGLACAAVWYRGFYERADMRELSLAQIGDFLAPSARL